LEIDPLNVHAHFGVARRSAVGTERTREDAPTVAILGPATPHGDEATARATRAVRRETHFGTLVPLGAIGANDWAVDAAGRHQPHPDVAIDGPSYGRAASAKPSGVGEAVVSRLAPKVPAAVHFYLRAQCFASVAELLQHESFPFLPH
jgi:hypothetical protein